MCQEREVTSASLVLKLFVSLVVYRSIVEGEEVTLDDIILAHVCDVSVKSVKVIVEAGLIDLNRYKHSVLIQE